MPLMVRKQIMFGNMASFLFCQMWIMTLGNSDMVPEKGN